MPYGQKQQNFNPQLMQAIAQQEQLRNKQQSAQNMMQPSGGAGGMYDILGAVLGGVMNKKYSKQASEGEVDIQQQIQAFQQQKAQEQEQKAQTVMMEKRGYAADIAKQKQIDAMALLGNKQTFAARNDAIDQENWLKRFGQQEQANQATADYRQLQQGNNIPQLSPENAQRKSVGLPTIEKEAYDKEKLDNKVIPESVGERKKRLAIEKLRTSLQNLHGKVKKHGTEYGGIKGAKMSGAYGDFFMKYKNAEELGAIQGADERLVKNIIGDPSSFGNQFNPLAGGNIQAQIEEYANSQGWDFTKDDAEEQATKQQQGKSTASFREPQSMKLTNDLLNYYGKK